MKEKIEKLLGSEIGEVEKCKLVMTESMEIDEPEVMVEWMESLCEVKEQLSISVLKSSTLYFNNITADLVFGLKADIPEDDNQREIVEACIKELNDCREFKLKEKCGDES